MKLFVEELTEEFARQLCLWKYEGGYSVYDFAPWDIAVRQKWTITDPEVRKSDFRSVVDEKGNLIGFFRMERDGSEKIEIGLGLAPDYCGRGIGKAFVALITQYTSVQYPDRLIYMEVRTFNKRAVKCYQACGYSVILRHHRVFPWGGDDYFHMEYAGKK